MGLVGWVKHKILGHQVEAWMEDAMLGRIGSAAKSAANFFSGWKSWLLATTLTLGVLYPESGILPYAETAVEAIPGGDSAAFDPQQAALAIAWVTATAGRFIKAIRQYQDGVEPQDVLSS